jgi:hypothetical protein
MKLWQGAQEDPQTKTGQDSGCFYIKYLLGLTASTFVLAETSCNVVPAIVIHP